MNPNINLNLLKYFYEAVNVGNITRASEKLLVSQPAITKSIRELERELDIKLLERSKKGVIPTEEGKILYAHIKDMFADFNSTLNILENVHNNTGHLYIGATTTNFINFTMNTLKKFKETFPNVHIHIVLEEMSTLIDMSRLGKLDIIIKNSYEVLDGFVEIKSFEINDKFVVSRKAFPELGEKQYSLKELLEYPFVLLSNITHGRRNFDAYLKEKKIEFKPTYEFNSYSLCKELIKNGFGIGIGNPIHYPNKDFIIINTDFNLPTRRFNIGYFKKSKNQYIQGFIDIMKKEK